MPRPRALPWIVLIAAVAAIALRADAAVAERSFRAHADLAAGVAARRRTARRARRAGHPLSARARSRFGRRRARLVRTRRAEGRDSWSLRTRSTMSNCRAAICRASPRSSRGKRNCRTARRFPQSLDEAMRDLPFQPGTFAPFLDDVEKARALPPLTRRCVCEIAVRRAAAGDADATRTTLVRTCHLQRRSRRAGRRKLRERRMRPCMCSI